MVAGPAARQSPQLCGVVLPSFLVIEQVGDSNGS
jgi:hypothetical protein